MSGYNLNGRVEVAREVDTLHRAVWQFELVDTSIHMIGLYLQTYAEQERPSTRHKWRNTLWYDRVRTRRDDVTGRNLPLPADVVAEAKSVLQARLAELDVRLT